MKEKNNIFDIILRTLPLFPILGILYQIQALYEIYKMNGLVFFSWTQAINDTAGIFPFAIPIILSIGGGILVCHWLISLWNQKKKHTWGKYLWFILVYILIGIIIASMLGSIFFFIFREWSWNSFLTFISIYFAYYFCGSFIVFLYQKISLHKGIFGHILPWIVFVYISMIGIYVIFPVYQQSTTTNICIWREKDTLIPISYMNDRFAFYSGAVMSDGGSESMGTGIIVFSRLENDRIIRCNIKNTIKK